MAVKAKLKRYRNGSWEEYYPETNTDQVVGLEQLISSAGGAEVLEFTATLSASNWSGTSPATQTVSVSGLLDSDDPIIDLTYSGNFSSDYDQFIDWSKVYRITTSTDSITAFGVGDITSDISIKLLVVR